MGTVVRFALSAAAAVLALPAAAQMVTAADAGSVLRAMQSYGLAATLTTDDQGSPKIDFKIEGVNATLFFFGCDGGTSCKSIAFDVGFVVDPPFTAERANEWNRSNRFGGAYVDDNGVARLAMDMNMVAAGVSPETFRETLDAWGRSISDFKPFINW
ncbi:MAG: YbjN domain-containing protein [Pseudomonadota bacterium]